MILFDEKFIHCMWSDELKGKECFVADNIYDLRHHVNYNENSVSVSGYDEQFGFEINDTKYASHYLPFAYYDPNYDIKWAFHNGEIIYYKDKADNEHSFSKFTVDKDFEFDFEHYECYLKKPEPEDYAFNSTDELIAYWESHYCNADRPENTMPLIWVKSKEFDNTTYLITAYDKENVHIEEIWIDMKELFEKYTFLDSRPCGWCNGWKENE